MKTGDMERFSLVLGACAELYGRTISEGAMSLWWSILERFDIGQIEQAFRRAVEDPDVGQYMPKPADIIRQINGNPSELALIAWGRVISAARDGGARFGGPTQEAIDAMGGMGRIRMSSESEHGFLQREFVAGFKAYKARADAAPERLGHAALRSIGDAR